MAGAVEASAPASASHLRPALSFSLVGVGAVAAIVGGVLGAKALSDDQAFKNTTQQTNSSGQPNPAIASAQSNIRTEALLCDVLVGTGIAAAASGLLLYFLWDDGAEKPPSAPNENIVRFDAGILPNGIFAGLHGTF
jgi:hypothetical protein